MIKGFKSRTAIQGTNSFVLTCVFLGILVFANILSEIRA